MTKALEHVTQFSAFTTVLDSCYILFNPGLSLVTYELVLETKESNITIVKMQLSL